MTTRKSTPKYAVLHIDSGAVVHTGISKTEARKLARLHGSKDFWVRPVGSRWEKHRPPPVTPA